MADRELVIRSAVAAVAIPIVFILSILGGVYFVLMVDLIVGMALYEFYRLAERKGYAPFKTIGILFVLAISWEIYYGLWLWIPLTLGCFIILTLLIELFRVTKKPLENVAISVFGLLYISLFSCFILIRELPVTADHDYLQGGRIIIYIFCTIWLCDSSAYILGVRLGKHALFPRISPNKSWEGAIIGFLFGMISVVSFRRFLVPWLGLIDAVIIGLIIGIVGQISDLIESLFKREYGVKDASHMIG
jgi:phosphatidate cytidylyltransferase